MMSLLPTDLVNIHSVYFALISRAIHEINHFCCQYVAAWLKKASLTFYHIAAFVLKTSMLGISFDFYVSCNFYGCLVTCVSVDAQ